MPKDLYSDIKRIFLVFDNIYHSIGVVSTRQIKPLKEQKIYSEARSTAWPLGYWGVRLLGRFGARPLGC